MTDPPRAPPPRDRSLVSPHLLTCPRRAEACAATLARWDATDWGQAHGRPRVHVDDQPKHPDAAWGDPRRGERIVRGFARFLAAAVDAPAAAPLGSFAPLLLRDPLPHRAQGRRKEAKGQRSKGAKEEMANGNDPCPSVFVCGQPLSARSPIRAFVVQPS